MADLTRDNIRSYAQGAGFAGNDLEIAVAVALAESGGNPRAHNAVPPDDSYGLWQINMLGKLGPDRRKRYKLASNADLFDPATNARVARGIWQGGGWKAWTTYTRGTYKKFMSSNVQDPDSGTVTEDQKEASGITGGINAIGETLFKASANLAGVVVAVALLVVGIVLLARNQIPVGKVAKKVLK